MTALYIVQHVGVWPRVGPGLYSQSTARRSCNSAAGRKMTCQPDHHNIIDGIATELEAYLYTTNV